MPGTPGLTTVVELTFDRYSASFDSVFRETKLSHVTSFSITGDLQPAAFQQPYSRNEFGALAETAYIFDVPGNPDIRVGDRTFVSSTALEVSDVGRYGTLKAEIQLRWLR